MEKEVKNTRMPGHIVNVVHFDQFLVFISPLSQAFIKFQFAMIIIQFCRLETSVSAPDMTMKNGATVKYFGRVKFFSLSNWFVIICGGSTFPILALLAQLAK